MMNMHSNYDNMHKNEVYNAFNCIDSHVIASISIMPSRVFLSLAVSSISTEIPLSLCPPAW